MKKDVKRVRPSWDNWFMFNALNAASRASCLYFQTGAVVVKEKRIIATGYNGAPPGVKNCLEVDCRKDKYHVDFEDKGKGICRGVHAEVNALSQVSRWDLHGTSLYTLYFPCSSCAKDIVSSGIAEVIYAKVYHEPESLTNELFTESGIKLRKVELDFDEYLSILKNIYEK